MNNLFNLLTYHNCKLMVQENKCYVTDVQYGIIFNRTKDICKTDQYIRNTSKCDYLYIQNQNGTIIECKWNDLHNNIHPPLYVPIEYLKYLK